MKGIILAGGTGSRMYPMTNVVCKQLLPVYDKPMIYYPLSTLMLAGIREILIITNPSEKDIFFNLLGHGEKLGLDINYISQDAPNGIAEAFILGEQFINGDSVCLILGDNILYGESLGAFLKKSTHLTHGAHVLSYPVNTPERYAVVTFESGEVVQLEEKPQVAHSNQAVIGIYFYDNFVCSYAKSLKPSGRGELEITDINKIYLQQKQLTVRRMGRGMAWFDAGAPDSIMDAASFVHAVEVRQGMKICCPEEIAWRQGYITTEQLQALIKANTSVPYYQYLEKVLVMEEHELEVH